jgi:hypothetical protein
MSREKENFERKTAYIELEKIFVIACEGAKTEKQYFQYIGTCVESNIRIETLPTNSKNNDGTDPDSVKKRLDKYKKEYNLNANDEMWLVIDYDKHFAKKDAVAFCMELQKESYQMAMSNPCFELWLLLHLKRIDEFSSQEQDCIFENQKQGNKNYIDVVLGKAQDEIRADGKIRGYNKVVHKDIYFPPLDKISRINHAIANTKLLDAKKQEDYPTSLGTHVYKLVEKLLNPASY